MWAPCALAGRRRRRSVRGQAVEKHGVPVEKRSRGRKKVFRQALSEAPCLSKKAGAAGLFRQDTFPLRLGARPGKRAGKPCCARLPNPPRMSPGSDCIWRASALQASPKGAFDGLGASDRLCRKPPFSPLRAASLTGPLRPRPACSPGQIRWCPCSS